MPFIDLPDGPLPGIHARAPREERPWYRFKNLASDEAELFLYDEIGGWGTLAEDFISELKAVTSPKLRVRVSSPGGSVFEGVALANALRAHPADVTVQVDGIAASIASVIAMAADRVVVQPQAMIMIHDAAGVCLGNAQDMQDMAALLDKISDNIADAYSAKAGGTRDEPKAEAEQPESVTLTFNVGETFGKELTEMLRASVARRQAEPAASVAEDTTPAEPVDETTPVEPAPAEPATEPEPEAPTAEPVDEWAAVVAHLTQDEPDAWSVLVSNLTTTTASSCAATDA